MFMRPPAVIPVELGGERQLSWNAAARVGGVRLIGQHAGNVFAHGDRYMTFFLIK
jgi:hypothetical protein